MSMSIGQLMKGLVGDAQPGDGKALELKVGQTVRGVLVKMTGDNEGIVQINGTPVRAKLETPLEPGQAALLQVQPESADGALVLKQADPRSAGVPEASVKEWIKALGLPDTQASASLVRDLRGGGAELTRELVSQFKVALAAMPEGGDAESWMRAAALAVRRGLPMTGATIGALQQVLAGPPAHALLDALEAGLAAWSGSPAGQGAGGAAAPSGTAQAAAAKLQALLAEGAALMRASSGEQPPAGAAGAGAGGTKAQPVPGGAASAVPRAAAGMPQANAAPQAGGAAQTAVADNAAARFIVNGAGGGLQTADDRVEAGMGGRPAAGPASAEHARLTTSQSGGNLRSAQAVSTMQEQTASSTETGPRLVQTSSGHGQIPGAPIARALPQPTAGSSWVGQLMKWMGVDHERLLATATIQAPPQPASTGGQTNKPATEPKAAPDPAATMAGQARATAALPDRNQQQAAVWATALQSQTPLTEEGAKSHSAETLKSALMAIASSDELPQQLRDTAQQLVAHITGQQLLMSPEKNGAMFSHVTMFVPMKGQDGSQTASVHIQTRRGRKGELDGENCRLVFDLRMKTLGDTVVDVQVVNKIVNLQVWNDHPAAAQLVESSRSELNDAMTNAGYQLLTLRVEAMPERIVERLNGSDGLAGTAEGQEWSEQKYRGVDLRI
ncbi:flagellar hook-length control protein FliK [Paenibacillus sacheonensis]|uniref:Flagellar hook-length control protein-like C-terminal domain-containing protein n=1 Tax=Paenibacillus sacheonensis TaxID=742054 RepID=A0A7X4YML9_9BACL|nr:flagellar hook-length control protein FliK [Paenibacillus sacheonensis]MBM7564591.1 hypothetical protein [Paenibacillus sacheonensis]NBC69148.1 hypothetical protein [Paenibacillus sacheonensis]